MARSKYYGRDLITTADWKKEELEDIIRLAREMKKFRYSPRFYNLLKRRTFMMFFYNPSVRTRQSFEAAAVELGGAAQYLVPEAMRLKTATTAGETIEDVAKVMSRYAVGVGIRRLEDKVSYYGEGNAMLREFAEYATVPVHNMADDKFHPYQGLSDIMGIQDRLGYNLKGATALITWASGALARSWCSVQEFAIVASMFGMNVRIAYPEGYDLDPEIMALVRSNCEKNGAKFEIYHDPIESYRGVNVVYSRNWVSPNAYRDGVFQKEEEKKKAASYSKEWICSAKKMRELTDNALFTHPMPIDRGQEVEDEVASGPNSIIYDVAEYRLHTQKAGMALTMSELWDENELENLGLI